MAKQTIPALALPARSTRALLACGVAAGPIYLAVTSAQALTRDGFDPLRHTWNVMTIGDLGWLQRSNLLLTGVLMALFAVGVRRVLGPGWGGRWASWLLVLAGVGSYIASAVFPADPQPGFPPGTSETTWHGMVGTTWHGMVHNVARAGGFAFVIAASLVVAGWFAKQGGRRRGWAWFLLATVPLGMSGVFHVVLSGGSIHPLWGGVPPDTAAPTVVSIALFIVLTLVPTWVWFTTLAVHLYRRVARFDRDAVPGAAGQGMRMTPQAG